MCNLFQINNEYANDDDINHVVLISLLYLTLNMICTFLTLFGSLIVNFEHISYLFLYFLPFCVLLILNVYLFAGILLVSNSNLMISIIENRR